jgi:hypothetical protein
MAQNGNAKPEGNRSFGVPLYKWQDNTKSNLKELGGDSGDWIQLTQDSENARAV